MRYQIVYGSLAALALLCSPPVLAQDAQDFAKTAGSSNAYEIEASKLALGTSRAEHIRAFAEQMIADHTAASEKMAAAAQADAVAIPVGMTEKQQAQIATLSTLTDAEFDAAYVDAQVAAHDEAVALFETFAADAQSSALRDFAVETLPVLQQHQAHAHSLKQDG